ncbi:GspH/FimT family pseudopilin [Caldimonas caldifontis]|uniref:GspH/FimT family pseudopilin n=1 Tax=Caldimonas caldifontis TaxID=1452508 RepID=UPI0030129D9D
MVRGAEVLGRHRPSWARQRGFTLLELLIVLSLMAIVVSTISLAIRDPQATALEREAERLAALLESARVESRATGVIVRWVPATDGFRFVGLPDSLQLPTGWMNQGVSAEVYGTGGLTLGPDPLIGPQRVTLALEDRRITIATDGLQAFAIAPSP